MLVLLLLCGCDKAVFAAADSGPRPAGVRPPSRPAGADGEDRDPATFVLREIALSSDGTRGWDLDRRCTLAGADDSECAPTGDPVLDLAGCRDDAFGQEVSATFRALGSELEAALSESALVGAGGALARVSHWSGEPDDPDVSVELAPVAGADAARPDGPLRFDGTDTFETFESALDSEGQATIRSDRAYFTDGQLVARFPGHVRLTFRARDRSITFSLRDTSLTMNTNAAGSLIATISGRWAETDVLEQLDAVGICAESVLRTAAEATIHAALDVHERSVPGRGMDNVPCNALSVSLGLEVFRGQWGEAPLPDAPAPSICRSTMP